MNRKRVNRKGGTERKEYGCLSALPQTTAVVFQAMDTGRKVEPPTQPGYLAIVRGSPLFWVRGGTPPAHPSALPVRSRATSRRATPRHAPVAIAGRDPAGWRILPASGVGVFDTIQDRAGPQRKEATGGMGHGWQALNSPTSRHSKPSNARRNGKPGDVRHAPAARGLTVQRHRRTLPNLRRFAATDLSRLSACRRESDMQGPTPHQRAARAIAGTRTARSHHHTRRASNGRKRDGTSRHDTPSDRPHPPCVKEELLKTPIAIEVPRVCPCPRSVHF